MELDGYCRALRCGFEADGDQHYGHVRFFHKKEGDYHAQKQRDHIKDRLCEMAGVTLIRTPPRSQLCDSQLALYLCQQLAERRVLYTHSS
jgi:very-short-patch-repair endonuclease